MFGEQDEHSEPFGRCRQQPALCRPLADQLRSDRRREHAPVDQQTVAQETRRRIVELGSSSWLVVYQVDSYVAPTYGSVVSVTLNPGATCEQPDVCLNGGTCQTGKCSCVSPYFGTQCQYQPVKMDADTFVKKFSLDPYQVWFLRENTDNGEPSISIELRSGLRPPTLMIMNVHDDDTQESYYKEQNKPTSQTAQLTSWTNDVETKSIEAEQSYFSVMVTNLATGNVNYQFTITRIRSNTYSVVSKVLLYLLLGVIGLLVIFSIITTIIRSESSSRLSNYGPNSSEWYHSSKAR